MERRVRQLMHRSPASFLDATPVEVVTDVQDVLRLVHQGTRLHCLCNQLLGLVVDSHHEAASLGATYLVLPLGVVASDELLMVAKFFGVTRIPSGPREDAGPGLRPRLVGDDARPALDGVQGAVHTAPVADREDMHLLHATVRQPRPGHTLVAHGHLRRLALDAPQLGVAALARDDARRAREARAARRLAAGARRGAALLAAGGRAEVEPLEVLFRRRQVIHAGDLLHVLEPRLRVRVVYPAARDNPSDGLLALSVLR
mmetsp:Transcript_91290/g.229482  ORF Transcript_91290/g.229482 Transcript_91290/m.229482 type:complete len:258 (-) Transcript_91290:433-1206(-)